MFEFACIVTNCGENFPEMESNNNLWKTASLKELNIPESAKAAAKSIKPSVIHLSVKV